MKQNSFPKNKINSHTITKTAKLKLFLDNKKKHNRWPYAQVDFTGRVAISPGLVIEYITRTNKYPSTPTHEAVQDFITQIRGEMENEPYGLQRYIKGHQYFRLYPVMTDDLLGELLIKSIRDKKYSTRPSPPFPAKLFPDLFLIGRDQRPYKSYWIGNSWRWILTPPDEVSDPGGN